MYFYENEKEFLNALKKSPSEFQYQLVCLKNILMERIQLEKDYKIKYNNIKFKYYELEKENYNKRAELTKKIPIFWFKCIENSSQFKSILNEKDKVILKNLENISCENFIDGNFKIIFEFNEKENKNFFKNKNLEILFIVDKDFNINEIKSSEINYINERMNPSIEINQKRVKNKKTDEITFIEEKKEIISFFNIFKNIKKGENKNLNENLNDIYEIGCHLKEDLIPNSIEYFLNLFNEDFDFNVDDNNGSSEMEEEENNEQ